MMTIHNDLDKMGGAYYTLLLRPFRDPPLFLFSINLLHLVT